MLTYAKFLQMSMTLIPLIPTALPFEAVPQVAGCSLFLHYNKPPLCHFHFSVNLEDYTRIPYTECPIQQTLFIFLKTARARSKLRDIGARSPILFVNLNSMT